MLQNLLDAESRHIAKKYKISAGEALEALEEKLAKNPSLLKKAEQFDSVEKLSRTSEYKNFIKVVRKDIYYSLRRYHSEPNWLKRTWIELSESLKKDQKDEAQKLLREITLSHVSTKERAVHIDEFNKQLVNFGKESQNVLDIGGGLLPMTFPFESFGRLENYVWLDKDKKAEEMLVKFKELFAAKNLSLFSHKIGEKPWEFYLPKGKTDFDLVLMIKLVPVVWRQERHLVQTLAQIPSKKILITGSKESMTKHESIQKREDIILHEFIKLTGKQVTGKLDIPNEFGYYLE